MRKRSLLFPGILLLVLLGGLVGKMAFSNSSTPPNAPGIAGGPPFKMSGVIQGVDEADKNSPRLILTGEGGQKKTVWVSPQTPILTVGGTPLKLQDLKAGDVVDMDVTLDETHQHPLVHKVSVVTRAEEANQTLPEDPEFE